MSKKRVMMNASNRAKSVSGFTLIEVMVVVVILAILAAVVIPNILTRPDQAKVTTSKANLTAFTLALDLYYLDNNRYPSTEQGLVSLAYKTNIEPIPNQWPPQGYLKTSVSLKDAWGNEYQYESPGIHNPQSYDLYSLGANGREDGEGNDAIIGNWDEE